jgi:hypothetical protein
VVGSRAFERRLSVHATVMVNLTDIPPAAIEFRMVAMLLGARRRDGLGMP